MSDDIHIAFAPKILELRLSDILPLRQIPSQVLTSRRYARIVASIATVGLAEPLVVSKQKRGQPYLILDGHLRHHALLARGDETVRCILADDDEAFTYNKRVNRLATVQEHYMIDRAIKRGASDELIAKSLGVDVNVVRRRQNLLKGIAPEVVEMFKDRPINVQTFEVLKKMKAPRQIEAAELMISANNFFHSYVKALLAATKRDDLAKPDRKKRIGGLSAEQMAKMEREMENLTRDMKAVEDAFGDDVLSLVVASGYIGKLLGNEHISAYLERRHPEISSQFRTIVSAASLEQPAP
ncbi:plasmid partitioning protein RepB C-terminal domain-containing protein [Sphingomonas oryzagri]|uniref:Plasmid partitioning protein RepB C-terminal domain-containing protein n=1 Tax=Sphingomonas oryzagri TaxID=3042314 RepID=A0ABT6N4E1_9SPHN|nr:plasmid partitioning protein RepB C-terminal domain-containing protein [Sphingomonas oryzagri]MDH7639962.1 plasmid partitioning protein RepB C-terminal domain-containing protein [Sphingomonas oryzagri]